jgi:hypothetical protein
MRRYQAACLQLNVAFEIAENLLGGGELIYICCERFDLQNPPRGLLPRKQFTGRTLNLIRCEESCLWNATASILKMDEADDLGLEFLADGVEEIGERWVVGPLGNTGAEIADGADLIEIIGKDNFPRDIRAKASHKNPADPSAPS